MLIREENRNSYKYEIENWIRIWNTNNLHSQTVNMEKELKYEIVNE